MGSRGPKPLPSNVHLLRGNASKKAPHQLMDSLQPEIDIPGCPPHLFTEAKKEWKRVTPELKRYGLVSKIDRAALSLYCQSWAMLVYAEQQMKRAMRIAEQKRLAAEARGEEYTGGDGMVDVTSNGNMVYSPYWVMANRAREQVDKFQANFGMSPSSRGRVNPSNFLQGNLFGEGEEDSNSAGGFGAI